MTPATLALVAQVIEMLISAASGLPEIIQAGQTAISLLKSNTDPTAEQEATIRAGLDAAHAAVQNA
jgi:hypothetical protein